MMPCFPRQKYRCLFSLTYLVPEKHLEVFCPPSSLQTRAPSASNHFSFPLSLLPFTLPEAVQYFTRTKKIKFLSLQVSMCLGQNEPWLTIVKKEWTAVCIWIQGKKERTAVAAVAAVADKKVSKWAAAGNSQSTRLPRIIEIQRKHSRLYLTALLYPALH